MSGLFFEYIPYQYGNQIETKGDKLLKSDEYKELIKKYNALKTLSLENCKKLLTDFENFQNKYMKTEWIFFVQYNKKSPFATIINNINNQCEQLEMEHNSELVSYHNCKIKTSDTEHVNGYYLFDIDSDIMNYSTFINCANQWKEWKYPFDNNIANVFIENTCLPFDIINIIIQYTLVKNDKNEMLKWLETNCCTDWNRINEHGDPFRGYYEYPDNSDEYINAYDLTREKNFNCLLELPYPYEIIKYTINWGCNNRNESVRYSNFVCEWIKRKMVAMKMIDNN